MLVTRPAAQAVEWVQALGRAGIDAVALPLIAIGPPADAQPLRAAWQSVAQRRLVFFVSPNAVEHFFAAGPSTTRWPPGVLAASPGPGTTAALLRHGVPRSALIEPPADAPQFDSEALWGQLQGRDWHGASVLMVRGESGRDWLADRLRGQGAAVDSVAAYQRTAPQFDEAERVLIDAALAAPARHLWFFSSSEAIGHLAAARPGTDWSAAQALATHPRIAATAQALGFGRVGTSRPSLTAVVACIQCAAP